MQYKSILSAVLLLLLLPATNAVFEIDSVAVQTLYNNFTNDTTPQITITLSGTPSDANQMLFSCDGTSFSSPVDHNGDAILSYSEFVVNNGSFGCSTSDGDRNVTVRITEDQNQELYKEKTSNDFNLDTIAPTIFNVQPADGNRTTNVQPTIRFEFSDNGSGITGSTATVSLHINGDLNVLTTITDSNAQLVPTADMQEGTYNLQADVNDHLGNHATKNWSFVIDLNAHLTSISINGGLSYARSRDVNMSARGDFDLNACQFRMDGSSYSGVWIPFSASMPFQLSDSDGNKTVWGQCKDALEHLTEEQSDVILLDRSTPSTPSPSISNIQANQVTMNWSDVTDTGSGLKEFQILNLKTGSSVVNGLGSTIRTYDITGLSPSTAYNFRLIARDYALNESYGDAGTTTLNSSSGGNGGGGGSGDTVSPTISWLKPDANAIVSGKIKLRVQVNDNNGVRSITFYQDQIDITKVLDWVPYKGTNQIEIEWDSAKVSNGNHELFAEVDDWGGNTAQASRKIKVQNADGNRGKDQNESSKEQSAKTALENAKTEQQKARAMIDLAKQFSFDFSEAQGKYSEGNSKLKAAQKACDQQKFSECETKGNEAIALFGEAASKTGLALESTKSMGEPGALDFKGIFLASKLNPALAAFAEEIQSQMRTERQLLVFKRALEDGNTVFFVRIELKIKNNSGAGNDFILVELVPKALAQSSDELVGNPEFVVLEKDPLLEWKLDGFKNGEEMIVSYTIDKAFSEQEIQALLDSSELNSYQLAPLIVKASAVQNTPMLLVPPSLLGFELLANPTVLAIIIGILVILAFVFLVWQKNKVPRWSGRNAW